MNEAADGLFFIETMRIGVSNRIDPVQQPILVVFDGCLQGVNHRRMGGLPQEAEEGICVSH